jgi:hypothetical protein
MVNPDPEIDGVLGATGRPEFLVAKAQAVLTGRLTLALDNHRTVLLEAANLQARCMDEQSGVLRQETQKVLSGLKEHGTALASAATASDKYASLLVAATWALVGATFLLVIVTGVLVYATLK